MIRYGLDIVSIFNSTFPELLFLFQSSIKSPDKSTGTFFNLPLKLPVLILNITSVLEWD